jgi:FKBP-type peptidyl-prolyl cis-trans isomerase
LKLNMKKINIVLSGLLIMALASCGESFDTKAAPKTSEDSFSYAVGLSVGKSLKKEGLEGIAFGAFIHGVRDAMSKDSGFAISEIQIEGVQRNYVTGVQAKKMKAVQDETKKFMTEKSKEAGVVMLPSKAYYKTKRAGTGAAPQAFDTVEFKWVFKTHKGKVLEDNSKSPKPIRGTVAMMGLAPLEEAFQKTQEGGSFELTISNELHPALAKSAGTFEGMYGASIFEVEILKVTPGMPPKEKK